MSRGEGRRSRRVCLPLDGVLLLDKPVGYTSNQALQAAKRLLNACKAGHTGSLDPIATGLLPLCFGEATKLSQFLIDADKRYRAVFRLGIATTTHDAEGAIVATRPVKLRRAEVETALRAFVGEIEQVPPMYSAIKLAGRPLYELARAGMEVERSARRVTIHGIEVLALEGDRLDLEIDCSKGTYVRSLAHDLGERLGCGAHVAELRRLRVGALTVERAVSLAALEALPDVAARAERLLPPDEVLPTIPEVKLTALATHYLCQGQPVSARHGFAPGWVRLYDDGHHFLGIGQVLDDGRVAPRRLMTRKP